MMKSTKPLPNKSDEESSYERTSILGKLFISHIFPIFIRGYRNNGLSLDDLDRCPKQDRVEPHSERLSRNWNRDKLRAKNPKFWWTLVRTFATDFTLPILQDLFEQTILKNGQILCLAVIIRYFSETNPENETGFRNACYAAVVLCLCSALFTLIFHPRRYFQWRIGMRVRTACCSLIYQKALRLSQASLGRTSVGQIVNLMSNDANRIDQFGTISTYLISGPVETVLATYIMWTYLGPSCLVGNGILVLLIPIQFGMAKLFSRIRFRTAKLTDTRLRLMHEIVSGMRVIKMYCWERPFADRVAQARKSEMKNIRHASYLKGLNKSIFAIASRISLFASFVVYFFMGNSLSAEAVFVSIALFNELRLLMSLYFPLAIRMAAELVITCQRIENFLMLDELKTDNVEREIDNGLDENANEIFKKCSLNSVKLVANNIGARWNPTLNGLGTLNGISLRLAPGDLLTVIGPVGSGKSSLLMALLGELPLKGGDISREGRLSYAGQQPWTFNDTVYNNILLGLDYDHRRYEKVVEACALNRDLELWPFGDQTLVGEKGVQLSGGQKARIELARAVYRNADIYLLDDPLSAVDAGVADHIFEKCILEHLQNKIRVLATHQIQFIQKATKVLVLKEGQSLAYGSYEELKEQGIDFVSLLAESGDIDETLKENHSTIDSSVVPTKTDTSTIKNHHHHHEQSTTKIKTEQTNQGSIKGHVYMEYIRAGATFTMFAVMILFTILSQATFHGSDIFLAGWTDRNKLPKAEQSDQQSDIMIYTCLIVVMFVATIFRAVSFYDLCLRASENLHHQIFVRLLRTPLSFFDANPVGRILNRFSKDMGQVDEVLVTTAFDLNLQISYVFGVIVTICLSSWPMLVPSFVLAILCFWVFKLYIVSARDLRRFEGIARSPVFSHVATSLSGLVSIRAFGIESSFQQQFHTFQNDHNSAYFMVLSATNGLGIAIDWLSNIYNFVVIASVMLSRDLTGGNAGLIISCALSLTFITSWTVTQTAEFESQITSVERIVEYKSLEQEASAESSPDQKPFKYWPAQGEIRFNNLSLVYGNNQDKPVLKNLSFVVKAGEKIGIVGRTGAGKSSMIAALFRLTEPSGVIRIDGVDIQSIGLDDLRRKISIIPQDPVIYSGTIRYNLDPFCQYADCLLWDALDHVQLRATVTNLEGQLDAQLNDSGSNLSVGQRQLICLARAILRRNQILVLDEATANIDHQTDSLIQQTIRSQFSACTVLTIAHRLPSIIDSDRVLVLDAGQIVEFDVPYLLLQRQAAFYEMCQKTGPKMYAHLLRSAQLAHENRLQNSV